MNYIQKFQQGGTIASFSPNWELLKSKQISFFPSNFNSLMPMQNPAFSNKLMYNKTNTYLDEYNKLLMQQKVLSQKAKDPKIGKEKWNELSGNLAEYPGFIQRLHEMQYKK